MRIVVSCLQSLKRHSLPAHSYWRTYFVRGLEEAGHEVLEVPDVDWVVGLACPSGAALDAWRARTWDAVLTFVRARTQREPIHMFLGYLYPRQVEMSAIQELQRTGIPCVNFFCDNVREFHRVPSEYRVFALNWVPEFEALAMYRAARLPYIHAPMPCWVPFNLRQPPPLETELPTFIGSADILREELLGQALRAGADFVVRGPGWVSQRDGPRDSVGSRRVLDIIKNQIAIARSQGIPAVLRKIEHRMYPLHAAPLPKSQIGDAPVGDDEYFRLTREAMVTIGVNRVPTARASHRHPLSYSRLRDIEAPMLGACYLTEWTEGVEQLYEPGTEIETYRTAQELAGKLTELRENPARRSSMRNRAQKRALEEHSVKRSLARICASLGLKA
jgi:Glycosyl transferases group 1